MSKEKEIADKIEPKLYPKYKKKEATFECTCGKRMVAYPFKSWKEEVVNRMYKLRLREVAKAKKEVFDELEEKNLIIRDSYSDMVYLEIKQKGGE